VQLAAELEVAPRTILRDVDAMTEAGLPIIVHQGNAGGIELGFNYRTRLTGLTDAEADALALQLMAPNPAAQVLGIGDVMETARAKLMESFPDRTRTRTEAMAAQVLWTHGTVPEDAYVQALAGAIRDARIVRLRARSPSPRVVHPVQLRFDGAAWALICALSPDAPIPQTEWGDLNISNRRFG
jgi:predicted DNA-binding transcriptional regulator YafY